MQRESRRLAAIVAADVAGYSRLVGQEEEGTLRALRAHRAELVDPMITEHGGRIANTAGDSLLIEFPSAVDAVRCSIAVQKGMAERNKGIEEVNQIQFRIGIHIGDVVAEGDDLLGDGINVAARLEALADPGGICISGATRDQVRDRMNIHLDDLGEVELKNIARPVQVWSWLPGGIVTPQNSETDATQLAMPDKPSIAVLPFDNLSGDPEQEYFADGMTEDIITLLATIPDLLVIARNSTFSYKGQSHDVRKVANELGVRYILEGSVRRAGNRIRVNAQFVEATSGNHIWADRYDRDLDDIFAVQDDVTQGIVGALQSRLMSAEVSHANRKPPEKLDAWGNVVKARLKMFAYRAEDMDEAEPLARRALEIQSDYAPAHAVLSQILAWRSYNGWTDDWLETAREAARHADLALSADSNNPTVLTDTAFALLWLGRFVKAVPLAERAIALNANSALTSAICGHVLAIVGRVDEGIELTQKAFVLSPKDPLEYMFHMYEGSAQYFAGNLELSKRATEHALRLKSDLVIARLILAAILERTGQTVEAKRELTRIIQAGSENIIANIFRPRTAGTLWQDLTDIIRQIYDGEIPET